MTWQSGTPFSVLSGRGTLNRSSGGRSDTNTAGTSLTKAQLDDLFQFRMTADGPFFINASAIGQDGRAVAPDGAAPFTGQVFFNPDAGSIGGLQRRMFSGPWTFNLDAGLIKHTQLTERQSIEFRAEATNVFNHPRSFSEIRMSTRSLSAALQNVFDVQAHPVWFVLSFLIRKWATKRQPIEFRAEATNVFNQPAFVFRRSECERGHLRPHYRNVLDLQAHPVWVVLSF